MQSATAHNFISFAYTHLKHRTSERIHGAWPLSCLELHLPSRRRFPSCLTNGKSSFFATFLPARFGELKKSIGSISQKVLTSNLRAMEEDGLLKREVFAEVPPRVEYTLTDRGRSLEPVIDAMRVWGEAHMAELIIEEEATYKQN